MRQVKLTVALAGALLMIAVPASSADVVYHFYTQHQWRVTNVGPAYQTAGAWHFCSESRGGNVGCSRAFSVANTVTGSVGVSDGILTDTLGYSVTKTTTTTGSATFPVPKRKIGIAQWRSLFTTHAVFQRQYSRRCDQFTCYKWSALNRYETAYANQYKGPGFREVIRR
jgi:hypothetical protein